MDKLLEMSAKELSRLEVMQRLSKKQMSQSEAGRILDVSTRQIKRLLRAYRQKGAAGLVSKQRGRKSNNRLAEDVQRKALNLLKTKYKGFGPTLAHEKLVEREKLKLSDESVRQLMIAEDLWKPRKAKQVETHQLRERRTCFGELIQIDGSPHDWFEGRTPACVLLVFIDDATGQLVQLLFVESESFFSYCQAAEGYFRQSGKPVAFYSDRHGIFRVNVPSTGSGEALTQFGRAMQELDIQIICANSPQAKGRVERVIQTLQDRLPKEMRLRGISNTTDGNAYLPEFIADFNQRFAVEPRSSVNAHRPLTAKEDLARILTWQETRTLSKNLTLQFQKMVYQIQTTRQPVLRKRKQNGKWSFHALIFTLTDPMLFALLEQPFPACPSDEQILQAALHFYDLRGGGLETQNKGDKQGLGLSRRNKDRFAAQEMLVLFAQLAHNLIIWTRNDLATTNPRFRKYGILRTVRDVFHIPGSIQITAQQGIAQITLNSNHPLAAAFQRSFAAQLARDHLSLILGKN